MARIPAQERCLSLEQVPFDDTPSAQEQFKVVPLAEVTSALKPLEHIPTGEGKDAETPEEAARPNARDLPRISAATEILETEEYMHWRYSRCEKTAIQLRDEMVINARREIDELRAKVQTDLSAELA
ncbi:hypothetical protein AXG93_4368s1020 [Marchantia polymorpha subsp. ruderalis]|uniref:Uncharacterized protein n=1 Tax=Marchantia polymorpha subsp. ruderalis TaxID=1480154 RepID=A0A176VZ30_MARPO|nr:hypothetical protein AXG93_4368s1020 [Marchantia polymorpha subsp. ruderalis]